MEEKSLSREKLESETDALHAAPQESFHIRPTLEQRFRPVAVKEAIQNVLTEELSGKTYSNDEMPDLTKELAVKVRNRVRDVCFNRYKLLVQIVLGEQLGAGVKIGARCMWDADSDNYASADYQNGSLFCTAAVFAVDYPVPKHFM